LVGRTFQDVFRAFSSRCVLILGVYRAPSTEDESLLPFVIASPRSDMLLRQNDYLYAYANPAVLARSFQYLSLPLVPLGNASGGWRLAKTNVFM
jgi:hypothetical protein